MNTAYEPYTNGATGRIYPTPSYGEAYPHNPAPAYLPPQNLFPGPRMGFTPLNAMINTDLNNAQTHRYATGMYAAQDIAALINPLSTGIDKILDMQRDMVQALKEISTNITDLQQAVHENTRELREEIQAVHQQAHKRADGLAEDIAAMGVAMEQEVAAPPEPQATPEPLPTGFLSKAVTHSTNARTAHNKIWVGGFFAHMTTQRLHEEFSKMGEIASLIRAGKGWAVITYVSADDAARAQTLMHGKWAKPDRRPGIKVTPWTSIRLPQGDNYVGSAHHNLTKGTRAQTASSPPRDTESETRHPRPNGRPRAPRQPIQERLGDRPFSSSDNRNVKGNEAETERQGEHSGRERPEATAPPSPDEADQEAHPLPGGSRSNLPERQEGCQNALRGQSPDEAGGSQRPTAKRPAGPGSGPPSQCPEAKTPAHPHHGSVEAGDSVAANGTAAGIVLQPADECFNEEVLLLEANQDTSSPDLTPPGSRHRTRDPATQPASQRRLIGKFGGDTSVDDAENEKQRIRDTHDYHEGKYVLRAKIWTNHQAKHGTNLKAGEVPGKGDCFYECFVRHENLQDSESLDTYRAVKARILDFAKTKKNKISMLSGEFLQQLPPLGGMNEEKYKTLLKHLQTNGSYAEEMHMQVAALALKVDIIVEDIADPGPILQKYHGSPLKEAASLKQIHLIARQDRKHPVYGDNFKPIRESNGTIITSDGHFWKVIDTSTSAAGNVQGSGVSRPKKHPHH